MPAVGAPGPSSFRVGLADTYNYELIQRTYYGLLRGVHIARAGQTAFRRINDCGYRPRKEKTSVRTAALSRYVRLSPPGFRKVSLSSPGERIRALFPRAKSIEWVSDEQRSTTSMHDKPIMMI